jgi:eukaryotic-like serine/threonine-protein kinase
LPNKRPMDDPEVLDQLRGALAQQYDVERVLGHGGMGMVVLGRDRALDRPVALKVISPHIDVTARHRQRFLQEARIVAKLRHPNIVAVYTAGEASGLLYFVMEYVPGESLRDLLNRDRCCEAGRAEAILRDLADALAFAHARGVVHRDIKPENVLLDNETGRAMLADFGVAQALKASGEERLTGPGVVVGSPQYMSPEQASGDRDLDGRSDIYALGLVGYEMLAGEPAFSAPSLMSVLTKQLTEPPPPLAPRAPHASPTVVEAITKALAKDPHDRWQNAADMAQALSGDTSTAGPASSPTAATVAPAATATPSGAAESPVAAEPPPGVATPPVPTPIPDRPPPRPFVGPGRREPRAGRARRLAGALAAASAVLLLAAPFAWFAWPRSRESAGDVSRTALLVIPFDVQSGDSTLVPLRDSSVSILAASLARSGQPAVAGVERSRQLVHAAGLDTVHTIGFAEARQLADRTGARLLVMGQITGGLDSVTVVATAYDVASGNPVAQSHQTAPAGADPRALFDAVARDILGATAAPSPLPASVASPAPQ